MDKRRMLAVIICKLRRLRSYWRRARRQRACLVGLRCNRLSQPFTSLSAHNLFASDTTNPPNLAYHAQ